MANNAPIGVFDSGVGGLTVVKEIINQLPQEEIIYFGDTARVPYGSKSGETVRQYSRQIADFLLSQGVKAIVIACNTASAVALETLQKELPVPVIGVVRPGAKAAAQTTKSGRIGVIGTETTIRSSVYTEYLRKTDPHVVVYPKACPLFVSLVEEGWVNDDPITEQVAERYLKVLKEKDIDTLVLGCTHYPLLRKTIAKIMGEGVTLVNPAYETAHSLKYVLADYDLLHTQVGYEEAKKGEVPTFPQHKFYVSDGAEKFRNFASSILPCQIIEVGGVAIETLDNQK